MHTFQSLLLIFYYPLEPRTFLLAIKHSSLNQQNQQIA